jgi:ATP-dependent DNA helicase RecG
MTVFGDLDVSVIDEAPPGRGETDTRLIKPSQLPETLAFVREKLRAGQQAYFIYPLVSPSAESDLKAAVDAHRQLAAGELRDFEVGLIHGQMGADEKQDVMRRFGAGEIDALVASVVIEVGIDVPNANVMVIEHAERFGLAQLHQLRGRIGRGGDNAHCILVANPRNPVAVERLTVMCQTDDGFEIAEQDLRIRGPGELFGARQHGLPELKVADLAEDFELLRLARRDAFATIEADPHLAAPHHQQLARELRKHYAGRLSLAEGA